MCEKITLNNGQLALTVSAKGAEIKSLVKDGKEYMWSGDPSVWSGQAPVLFPICGGLIDDTYMHDGKEYTLPKHGFGRLSLFELESATDTAVTFMLRSDEDTLKNYPFEHILRVTFELNGSAVDVTYSVENTGNDTMYFSFGAHEAYACHGGVEGYKVVFEYPEELKRYSIDGNLVTYNTVDVGGTSDTLVLKNDWFCDDALVFIGLKSRRVSLLKPDGERVVTLDFKGHDYLLVWTKPDGEYICLEPWCGIPDRPDSTGILAEKEGIVSLEAGKAFSLTHTITL